MGKRKTEDEYKRAGDKVGLKLVSMASRAADDSTWACAKHPVKHWEKIPYTEFANIEKIILGFVGRKLGKQTRT